MVLTFGSIVVILFFAVVVMVFLIVSCSSSMSLSSSSNYYYLSFALLPFMAWAKYQLFAYVDSWALHVLSESLPSQARRRGGRRGLGVAGLRTGGKA